VIGQPSTGRTWRRRSVSLLHPDAERVGQKRGEVDQLGRCDDGSGQEMDDSLLYCPYCGHAAAIWDFVPAQHARLVAAAEAAAEKRALMLQRLPMILIGIVAALSVGYGIGTLVQFDHDWRASAPTLMTSVQGSVAEGTTLSNAVTDVLADNGVSVSDVQCPDAAVVGGIDELMCHARTGSGMVSLVASGPATALQVDVYTGV